MPTRRKFATQVDSALLDDVADPGEGRGPPDSGVGRRSDRRALIEQRRQGRARPHVMAAYQRSHAPVRDTLREAREVMRDYLDSGRCSRHPRRPDCDVRRRGRHSRPRPARCRPFPTRRPATTPTSSPRRPRSAGRASRRIIPSWMETSAPRSRRCSRFCPSTASTSPPTPTRRGPFVSRLYQEGDFDFATLEALASRPHEVTPVTVTAGDPRPSNIVRPIVRCSAHGNEAGDQPGSAGSAPWSSAEREPRPRAVTMALQEFVARRGKTPSARSVRLARLGSDIRLQGRALPPMSLFVDPSVWSSRRPPSHDGWPGAGTRRRAFGSRPDSRLSA